MKNHIFVIIATASLLITSCQEEVLEADGTPASENMLLDATTENAILMTQVPLVGTVGPLEKDIIAISPGELLAVPTNTLERLGSQVASVQYRALRSVVFSGGSGGATYATRRVYLGRGDQAPFVYSLPLSLVGIGNYEGIAADLLDSNGNILRTISPVILRNGMEVRLSGKATIINEVNESLTGLIVTEITRDASDNIVSRTPGDVLREPGQSTTFEIEAVAGARLYDISLVVNSPQLPNQQVSIAVNS